MDLGPRRGRERSRRLERSRGGEGEGGPGGSRGREGEGGVLPRSLDFPLLLSSSWFRLSIMARMELFITLRESSRDSILAVLSCDMSVVSGAVDRGGIGVIDDKPGIFEDPGIGVGTTAVGDGNLEIVSRGLMTSGCC